MHDHAAGPGGGCPGCGFPVMLAGAGAGGCRGICFWQQRVCVRACVDVDGCRVPGRGV